MLLLKLPFPFQNTSLKFMVTSRPKHCQINNNQPNVINKNGFTFQHCWPARCRVNDVPFTSGKGGFQLSRGSSRTLHFGFFFTIFIFKMQDLIPHSGQMPANFSQKYKTPPRPSIMQKLSSLKKKINKTKLSFRLELIKKWYRTIPYFGGTKRNHTLIWE